MWPFNSSIKQNSFGKLPPSTKLPSTLHKNRFSPWRQTQSPRATPSLNPKWKCNFLPALSWNYDRPKDQPTDGPTVQSTNQQTDRRGNLEVILRMRTNEFFIFYFKYCVFSLKLSDFLNSASSAAALVFYLPLHTEEKPREARVRNIYILNLKKKQYLMNTLFMPKKFQEKSEYRDWSVPGTYPRLGQREAHGTEQEQFTTKSSLSFFHCI